mmetsp:Transcript_1179/g.3176  ORF Transcript_1179/g.3176 Transcript_1179/m.3176 type:complete len:266 (+) Transcript_1179:719-1516(+)
MYCLVQELAMGKVERITVIFRRKPILGPCQVKSNDRYPFLRLHVVSRTNKCHTCQAIDPAGLLVLVNLPKRLVIRSKVLRKMPHSANYDAVRIPRRYTCGNLNVTLVALFCGTTKAIVYCLKDLLYRQLTRDGVELRREPNLKVSHSHIELIHGQLVCDSIQRLRGTKSSRRVCEALEVFLQIVIVALEHGFPQFLLVERRKFQALFAGKLDECLDAHAAVQMAMKIGLWDSSQELVGEQRIPRSAIVILSVESHVGWILGDDHS